MGRKSAAGRLAMRGFTIIELMIVVMMITIMSTIAIPYYQKMTARAHRAEMSAVISKMRMQLIYLYQNNGTFPIPVSGTDSSWNPADPVTGTPPIGQPADWKPTDPDWKDIPSIEGGVRMRYQYSVSNSGRTVTLTAVGSFPGVATNYTYTETWNGADPAGAPVEFPIF